MSLPVSPLSALPEIRMPDGLSPSRGASQAGDFQAVLAKAIGGVERLGANADQSVARFLAGDGEEVHSVALATQRAELAFELFLQVRNKVVSAYQSVMQMQV